MSTGGLSPHFDLGEFDCKDGTDVPKIAIPAVKRLCVEVLEPLRKKFGVCTVHSGHRSATWNRRVGGAPASRHLYLRFASTPAADVSFEVGNPEQWAAHAIRMRVGGVGLYQSHVHVDQRRGPARW